MPNWCYTHFTFHGTESEIYHFRDKIEEWTSKTFTETSFGETWLGNILYGVGLEDRIDLGRDNPMNIRCRGSLTFLDTEDDIRGRNNCCKFTLSTETAWCPMITIWIETIKKLGYKTIGFSYQAEESGVGLYEVYDPYGDYPEKYYADVYLDDEDIDDPKIRILTDDPYINSDKEMVEILQELLGSSKTDVDDLIYEAESEYPFKCRSESYIEIHKFEPANPMWWV